MKSRFWKTESAVPRYQCSPICCCAGSIRRIRPFAAQIAPAALNVLDQGLALYCVSTAICRMPEFTQLDSTKSMMRNFRRRGSRACSDAGQVLEAFAAATGHHDGQGTAGQAADIASCLFRPAYWCDHDVTVAIRCLASPAPAQLPQSLDGLAPIYCANITHRKTEHWTSILRSPANKVRARANEHFAKLHGCPH